MSVPAQDDDPDVLLMGVCMSHEALRAALAEQTAECQSLTAQLTEAREARQREDARHEAKLIAVMNERDEARQIIADAEAALPALDVDESKPLPKRIADEMADYYVVMDHCSEVYYHFTRSQISKPMTLPSEVIRLGEDIQSQDIDEAVKEEVESAVTEARGQVIAEIRKWLESEYRDDQPAYGRKNDIPITRVLDKIATLDTRREGEE